MAVIQKRKLEKIIPALKPGDYVLIQFGANDSGTAHGPHHARRFAATYGQMADEVLAKSDADFCDPLSVLQWTSAKEDNTRLAPYAAVR